MFARGVRAWFGRCALTLDRYVVFGTFEQRRAGNAGPTDGSPVSAAMNVVGMHDALGFAVLAVLLVRSSGRIRPA